MKLPEFLTRTPRVCPRCFGSLPKHARICPNCGIPQERLDMLAGILNVLFAIALLSFLLGAGWMVYRLIDMV